MSSPFIGEIALVGFNFAPAGWAFCDGSLLQIAEYDALFALIGTTYGGDGQTTFALPDLRSRVPIHVGTRPGGVTYVQGQTGGNENIALSTSQMPAHSHTASGKGASGDTTSPAGAVWAASSTNDQVYQTAAPNRTMAGGALANTGSSQGHNNRQPYLGLNYIISLYGVFPTQ